MSDAQLQPRTDDTVVIDYEKDPRDLSDEEIEVLLNAAENRIGGEFGRLIGELRQSSSSAEDEDA